MSLVPEGWAKFNAYTIRKAGWWVRKDKVGEMYRYTLYDEAKTRYGTWDTVEDAVAHATSLDLAMTA